MELTQSHNTILDQLLALRKIDPTFNFWLRKKKPGLEKGYWFQGTDHYISVGLVSENSGNLSTKSLALHFDLSNNQIQGYLILENRLKEKSSFFDFYSELSKQLSVAKAEISWYKRFDGSNGIISIIQDFWKFYPILRNLISKHQLNDRLLISDEQFLNSLNKVELYRTQFVAAMQNSNDEVRMLQIPLNQILYGPPGTGKTYNTIDKVVEICAPEKYLEQNHAQNKLVYDELQREGRVFFTTFHQSMSYEDFIEGIKPVAPRNESDPIQYKVEDGLFKSMCEQCMDEIKELKNQQLTNEVALTFREMYIEFVRQIKAGIISVVTRSGLEVRISKVSASGNMRLMTGEDTRDYIVSANRLEKLLNAIPNPDEVTNVHETVRKVIGGCHSSLYFAALMAYKRFEEKFKKSIEEEGKQIDIENITLTPDEIEALPKYVFVIDEINRGNVSAIFGELITLIEEDKRFGGSNQLMVKLPYSKNEFVVPPNLYIIGTMNTADRSVEALDTALRRRFSFVEMMPRPELVSPSALFCNLLWQEQTSPWSKKAYQEKENELLEFLGASQEVWDERKAVWTQMLKDKNQCKTDYFDKYSFTGFDLQKILNILNQRIEALIDRDHMIGHAYFMYVQNEDDLMRVFKDKIIPLLQEYFFGDYGKIGLVLGSGFVKKGEIKDTIFTDFEYEGRDGLIQTTYELIPFEDVEFEEAIHKLMN